MLVSSANSAWQILVLMRHAKRAGEMDRLTSEGLKQANELPENLAANLAASLAATDTSHLPHSNVIFFWRTIASPKLRTQETLRTLSQTHQTPTEVCKDLDERQFDESTKVFEARVRYLLDTWHDEMAAAASEPNSAHEIRVICSHLDWLETASIFLSSDESDLERSKAWLPMEIRMYLLKNGIWSRLRR
jgi:phosphohistidine phosphatase SixA